MGRVVDRLIAAQADDLAVTATRLSWSQTRQLCAAARTVTVARRPELDAVVGSVLDAYRGCHPDELVGRVWQIADGWQPSRLEKLEAAAEDGEFLAVQPNFEGGGSLYGQFGPAHFAIVGEALDTPLGPPVARPDPDDGTTSSRPWTSWMHGVGVWPASTARPRRSRTGRLMLRPWDHVVLST